MERTIRSISLSRRHASFAGSERGAWRWAIVASLIETAGLNGIEPSAELRDSLAMMLDGHPVNRLDELLPWSGRAGCS